MMNVTPIKQLPEPSIHSCVTSRGP